MFSWSADTVRFMADACRRTDFHEKLTALLLPYLKPTDHICDAGCGLGYLSLALSSHAAHITAAECDAAALSVLLTGCAFGTRQPTLTYPPAPETGATEAIQPAAPAAGVAESVPIRSRASAANSPSG